jgi:dolichol-phosphate mannosyltransferase
MSTFEALTPHAPVHAQTSRLVMVVPTYQEAENVDRLIFDVEAVRAARPFDVLIVDDASPDGTGDRIRALQATRSWLHLLSRSGPAGLGSAYRDGFRWALRRGYDRIGEMDADLSHDPASIPSLLAAVDEGAGLAIGSRYVRGGATEGWPASRRMLSRGANVFARMLLRIPVRDVTAGFRVYDRSSAQLVAETGTHCDGYGFQVEAAHAVSRSGRWVAEVPIRFTERQFGSSKMSASTAKEAASRCVRMAMADARDGRGEMRSLRLALFIVIGVTGLIVNQLVLWGVTDGAGTHYLISAIIATQVSSAWNFGLTERVIFDASGNGRARRFALFLGMNNLWMGARAPLLVLLTSGLGVHYLISNLLLLLLSSLARFAVSDAWIWAGVTRRQRTWLYDVHGLARIHSAGRLPELARFAVDSLEADPDIVVSVCSRGFGGLRLRPTVREDGSSVEYIEQLGGMGFAMRVVNGDRTDVTVSRAVSWSPHVLYANVVEPLLRWQLVRRGYVLAHAACLEMDGVGVLVTARTDTGKTTTCLKSIRAHGSRFLSDDMVILKRDGTALSYPKPLTISAHTLNAVRAAPLPPARRALLHLQSRLHSKGGRAVGMRIARLNLPVATLNGLTQMIVPPPKFFVEELIPEAQTIASTRIERMLLIERGDELSEALAHEDGCAVLAENTEDAYGFPPYPMIGAALRNGHERIEHSIRADALALVRSVRVRTPDREWFERLPALARQPERRLIVVPEVAPAHE